LKLRLNKSNYNHGREQCPDKLILLSTVHFLEWTVISCFSGTDVWIKKINKGDLDICSNSLTNVWVIKKKFINEKKIHKWKKKPIKKPNVWVIKKNKIINHPRRWFDHYLYNLKSNVWIRCLPWNLLFNAASLRNGPDLFLIFNEKITKLLNWYENSISVF